VLEAPTLGARFSLLERYLESRLIATDRCGNPAVRHAISELRSSRNVRLGDLTARMGISQRRFIESFRHEVGLTPKLYQRVARFQRVLASIESAGDAAWSDIALSHGYFDQAHLIHDFSVFAGVPPTVYLDRRVSRNHVALRGPSK
jgi:methylphosphotriester-DNA--protein-cysteine methyltransferase